MIIHIDIKSLSKFDRNIHFVDLIDMIWSIFRSRRMKGTITPILKVTDKLWDEIRKILPKEKLSKTIELLMMSKPISICQSN